MPNYKNQYTITGISVENIKHHEKEAGAFMQPFQWEKMDIALYLLTGNEYKVYMYLMRWAGQGHYDFSPSGLKKALDIGEDTARTIFKKFIKYGYLQKQSNTYYTFNPYPEKALQFYKEKQIQKLIE